jgi:signal peptidase I
MQYFLVIGYLCLVLILLRRFLVVLQISGDSMLPTLSENDKVLALRYWPTRWLKKGHIVVVSIPREGIYIKRVVALPGEMFRALIPTENSIDRFLEEEKNWEIPPEHFFVCGDNPTESYDSRYFGPLKYSSLYGLVIFRLSRTLSSEIHA